jgi:ABC-type nitrate/sulfonate/bicarbonate transport system permease component
VAIAETVEINKRVVTRGAIAKMRLLGTHALPPLGAVAIILGAWEAGSRTGVLPEFVFSSPSDIGYALWDGWSFFWPNTRVTLVEIAAGTLLGVVTGVVLGGLVASVPLFRRAFYPLMVASQSLPFIFLGPVLVLWLGYGTTSKIALVVQVTFFPIAVATINGLLSVSPEVLMFAESLGATRLQLFRKVRAPAALPSILTGLRVAATYAPLAAVFGEWIGSSTGLGSLMVRFNQTFRSDRLLATVLIITLISLLLFGVVGWLQRSLVPWAYRRR